MNNESVAWIRQGEYGKPIIVQNPLHQFSYQAESAKWDDIPHYTHPAKTLTDEEIISSAEEAGFNWSEDKGIFVRHSNGSWIGLDSKMVDFARAILRKAQEK